MTFVAVLLEISALPISYSYSDPLFTTLIALLSIMHFACGIWQRTPRAQGHVVHEYKGLLLRLSGALDIAALIEERMLSDKKAYAYSLLFQTVEPDVDAH